MKRLLVIAATTLAILAMGAPAEAVCSGCGAGGATPGFAEVATLERGVRESEVLNAGCRYTSASTGTGVSSGQLYGWAYATEPPNESAPYVTVECRLYFKSIAQPEYVDATGSVRANRTTGVPANMAVDRLCIVATAEWYLPPSWSYATIDRCVHQGLQAAALGIEFLDVPLPG